MPEGLDRILTAPLLKTDSMFLSDEIVRSGGSFPWRDTAEIDLGDGICGPVSYKIVPEDGFVQLTGNTVVWGPDLSITPGDFTYKLIGTLTRYGISADVDFTVRALACETVLDASQINLSYMSRLWSQDADSQTFGSQLSKLRQSPNCEYSYTLTARRVFPDSDMIDWDSSLPVEVGFNSDQATFSLSKCSPYGTVSDYDTECNDGTVPRVIESRIAMIVVLDNAAQTSDYVFFNTRIEGCSFDSVYLSGAITTLDYYIYSPAQIVNFPVTIDQDYDRCPLRCELIALPSVPFYIDAVQVDTPGSPLSLMDKSFTTYINTNLVELDGNYLDMQIACESEDASTDRKNAGVAYVTTSFRVTFYDACQFADIMPATRASIEIPLYQESSLDLIQPSTDAVNCPTITNEVTVLSSTATVPTEITSILGPLVTGSIGAKLATNPTIYDNVGDYVVKMTSCVGYGADGNRICVDGESFTISIFDPCPYTKINSSMADRVMEKPQLQTDTLNLFNEMPIGAWTWPVELDVVTPSSYGTSLCGPVIYSVMTNEVIP